MGETVATLLTGPGQSAIAVVGLAGPQAQRILSESFIPAGQRPGIFTGMIRYGTWRSDLSDSPAAREGVVVVQVGVQQAEIHCHGGKAAAQTIISSMNQRGARSVSPNQFQWLLGIDPDHAEMQRILSATNTTLTAYIALQQLRGVFDEWRRDALQSLSRQRSASPSHNPMRKRGYVLGKVTRLRSSIFDDILRDLQKQKSFILSGRQLTEPLKIVIAGPPNVGKSSLLNAIVGYHRAITFDLPGTTRDVTWTDTALNGWPAFVSDTAGIHESSDQIEQEGVRRAFRVLDDAHVVVLVVDATKGIEQPHQRLLAYIKCPIILSVNKIDLIPSLASLNLPSDFTCTQFVSATNNHGIAELCDSIINVLLPNRPSRFDIVPVTPFQRRIIEDAINEPNAAGLTNILNRRSRDFYRAEYDNDC